MLIVKKKKVHLNPIMIYDLNNSKILHQLNVITTTNFGKYGLKLIYQEITVDTDKNTVIGISKFNKNLALINIYNSNLEGIAKK